MTENQPSPVSSMFSGPEDSVFHEGIREVPSGADYVGMLQDLRGSLRVDGMIDVVAWNAAIARFEATSEAQEPDDDGIEMEDNHSLGVAQEQMAEMFPLRPLHL